MPKVTGCVLIIRDDFNNVLTLQKKMKRGERESFIILNQKLKGKETEEKCVNKCVKDSLKSIIFDLHKTGEYKINDEEVVALYVGLLKERIVLDKAYIDYRWIGKRNIEDLNFEELHKNILVEYFS